MKFVQLHTFYHPYLEALYQSNPDLMSKDFDQQVQTLLQDGHGALHMLAPYMRKRGYEATLIIGNCLFAQAKWIEQHRNTISDARLWQYEIARKQIEALKPDILYVSDPITFDSRFLNTLAWKPRLVAGWRGASIPLQTDLSTFDLILSHLSPCRREAVARGAASVEHFFPGFPEFLLEAVLDEPKKYDVVFSGQWTPEHKERNRFIEAVAEASRVPGKEFSVGFFIAAAQPDKLPDSVRRLNRGPMWGIDMHRALRWGRVVINAEIDLARGEAGNMRLFEATGTGSFMLTEFQGNIHEYFSPGIEIETFSCEGELIEKIHYYLRHPEERESIARRGNERCLRDYSMQRRVDEFDRIMRKHISLKSKQGSSDQVVSSHGKETALKAAEPPPPGRVCLNAAGGHEQVRTAEKGEPAVSSTHAEARAQADELKPTGEGRYRPCLMESVITMMQRGLRALQADRNDEALEALSRAKGFKIPVMGLDHLRALYFIKTNRSSEARQALLEELRYFPDNADAKNLLEQLDRQYPDPFQNKIFNPDSEFKELVQAVRPYTQLSVARLQTIFNHAKDICKKGIPGNFVECGVAAGGSTAVLAYVAKHYSKLPRMIYAFDSFEGMPQPTAYDVHNGVNAQSTGWGAGTCAASEDSVKEICSKLGVMDRVTLVKGYFEDTLPLKRDLVGMISFLHLDGDWYESTRAILANLYDRIVNNGILQVDDYGYWEGCRRAVHEFERERNISFDIRRIDETGVWLVKPDRFPLNPAVPEGLIREFKEDDPSARNVESQMSENERFQLHYSIRRLLPAQCASLRFIEIGSYSGASLLLMRNAIRRITPNFQGFAVEPAGTGQFYDVLGTLQPTVIHLKMCSFEAAPLLENLFGRDGKLADVILVDGDHSYEGVYQDILKYFPLLAPGGLMIFHDYLPPLDEKNREAIFFHHGGKEPGIRRACHELMEASFGCQVMDLPLLYPTDPTQTQAHLPIIPGVYSTIRVYRKPL